LVAARVDILAGRPFEPDDARAVLGAGADLGRPSRKFRVGSTRKFAVNKAHEIPYP
jgi:hypothetical protein